MVNDFYVVRNIGTWEVRHSKNPDHVWGKFKTSEEAHNHLKEAYVSQQVKSRLEKFLEDTSKALEIPIEQVIKDVKSIS